MLEGDAPQEIAVLDVVVGPGNPAAGVREQASGEHVGVELVHDRRVVGEVDGDWGTPSLDQRDAPVGATELIGRPRAFDQHVERRERIGDVEIHVKERVLVGVRIFHGEQGKEPVLVAIAVAVAITITVTVPIPSRLTPSVSVTSLDEAEREPWE
jgi:hypothetical protein